ncbi:MAG TPA: hypothetical protein VGU74_15905 [Gemmatimonadales bacterium]|nr:hypothetical protein [Gemmatimonadales bacterium]
MKLFDPQRSRIRTLLFGALVVVWFGEMVLWGAFAEMWTRGSNMIPPENPQLATALYITHAVEAATKGALGVLAVFGLRSRNAFARTALFLSMALVPPLNIAFPFREQGFPLRWMAVATVFSVILWGSFFLFREPAEQPEQRGAAGSGQLPPARGEAVQYVWLAAYSAALTLMAVLFLFAPRTALNFIFPCLSSLMNAHAGDLSSLVFSNLFNGTHLLALATASWIATAYSRSNPTLRQAMTLAGTVHAGLLCLLPLRRIILEFGGNCATSSILVAFVPLLVGWVLYAAWRGRLLFSDETLAAMA